MVPWYCPRWSISSGHSAPRWPFLRCLGICCSFLVPILRDCWFLWLFPGCRCILCSVLLASMLRTWPMGCCRMSILHVVTRRLLPVWSRRICTPILLGFSIPRLPAPIAPTCRRFLWSFQVRWGSRWISPVGKTCLCRCPGYLHATILAPVSRLAGRVPWVRLSSRAFHLPLGIVPLPGGLPCLVTWGTLLVLLSILPR